MQSDHLDVLSNLIQQAMSSPNSYAEVVIPDGFVACEINGGLSFIMRLDARRGFVENLSTQHAIFLLEGL